MVVISQDGKKLVNFNKVSEISVKETKIVITYENECYGTDCVGEYTTEEKAISVLNMFFRACLNNLRCFQIPKDDRVRMK